MEYTLQIVIIQMLSLEFNAGTNSLCCDGQPYFVKEAEIPECIIVQKETNFKT